MGDDITIKIKVQKKQLSEEKKVKKDNIGLFKEGLSALNP